MKWGRPFTQSKTGADQNVTMLNSPVAPAMQVAETRLHLVVVSADKLVMATHYYTVTWDQLHRDARALAWRLIDRARSPASSRSPAAA